MELNLIDNLLGVYLVIFECEKILFWKLIFPSISEHFRDYISLKINKDINLLNQGRLNFYHFNDTWLYIKKFAFQVNNYKSCSIIIKSNEYNEQRYDSLITLLYNVYKQSSFNDIILLRNYLNLFTKTYAQFKQQIQQQQQQQFINTEIKPYLNKIEINDEDYLIEKSSLKDIIRLFDLKVIIIYTAVVLKKRIVVYDHRRDNLISFVHSLTLFAKHRKNFSKIIYPLLDFNCKEDLHQIMNCEHYIAGFISNHIESRQDLYDLLINTAAVELTINEQSKDSFMMTKVHKELALFMKRLIEQEKIDNKTLVDVIATKTEQLIDNLSKPLSSSPVISSPVNTKLLNDPLTPVKLDVGGVGLGKNFYRQLAKAEGVTID